MGKRGVKNVIEPKNHVWVRKFQSIIGMLYSYVKPEWAHSDISERDPSPYKVFSKRLWKIHITKKIAWVSFCLFVFSSLK